MWFWYIAKQYNYIKLQMQFLCQAYSLWFFFLNEEGRCYLNLIGTDYICKYTDLFSLAMQKDMKFLFLWNTASVKLVYSLWIMFPNMVNERFSLLIKLRIQEPEITRLSSIYQQLLPSSVNEW